MPNQLKQRAFVAFTLLLSLGAALLFGLAPARQASRPDVVPELKETAMTGGPRGRRLSGMLVVAQLALTTTPLAGAGLLVRTMIRLAGTQAGDVLGLIIRQGLRLALGGLALGLVAAFGLTRVLAGFLHDVSATDPLTFTAIPLLLAAVALLACYLPARRATKVDPLVAIRRE